MKASDKIYAYIPEDDNVGTCSLNSGKPHQFVNTEYIRKDALKAKVEKHLANIHDWIRGAEKRHAYSKKYYEMKGQMSAYDAILSYINSL